MTTTIDLDTLQLAKGSHGSCNDPQTCLYEAYNLLLGRDKTDDCPPGVSPVLHRFGMRLNDALPDDKRQALKAFLPQPGRRSLLDGTADDGLDETRRNMAVDWAVRVATPMWLDAAGQSGRAEELRALVQIDSKDARLAVRPKLRALADELWEMRREALAKLRQPVAVAAAVADAVAVAAAAAVAVAAAVADAVAGKSWGQVYDETYRATRGRIEERYAPVKAQMQDSAIELFRNMVRPSA